MIKKLKYEYPSHPKTQDDLPSSSDYTKLNDRLAVYLVAILLLAPIPLGSNRPVWWLVLGLAISGGAVWHLLRGMRIAPNRRLQMMKHRQIFILGVSVVGFGVIQALPIADMLPGFLLRLPGSVASTSAIRTISVAPDASLLAALRLIIYLIFLVLVFEVAAQPNRGERIGWMLFFGITAHAVWGLISLNFLGDTLLLGEKFAYQGVATGTFVNRNSYATFLGFGIVLGVALSLGRRAHPFNRTLHDRSWLSPERVEMLAIWVMISLIALALLATQSRMGVFATIIAGLLTFVVISIKQQYSVKSIIATGGVGLFVLATVAPLGGNLGVLERFLFVEQASETRLDFYRQMIGMIEARPFTGYGLDAFAAAFELHRAPPITSPRVLELGHNSYLTLWVELGLFFGSLPLIALITAAGVIIQRILRQTTNLAMPAAALGVLCLGAIHSLVDFSLEIPANLLVFLAVVAIGAAHWRKREAETIQGL
ncbi:O-antigen ligase family protein [Roseicitreum antarcticum]|nr:O-antigen ligase family protein [Roseicitreum antarcticum]